MIPPPSPNLVFTDLLLFEIFNSYDLNGKIEDSIRLFYLGRWFSKTSISIRHSKQKGYMLFRVGDDIHDTPSSYDKGDVSSYNPKDKKHKMRVLYAYADEEVVDLNQEMWMMLDDTSRDKV
ncbi:hypothetical protein Tco_0792386 [Tanacetum coccineum]